MDIETPLPARTARMQKDSRSLIEYQTSAAANTSYTFTAYGPRHLIVTTDNANAFTVTLPPIAEVAGQIFSVYLDVDGGVDVTISDAGDDADFGDSTLDDADDCSVLFSNGVRWIKLIDGAAQ